MVDGRGENYNRLYRNDGEVFARAPEAGGALGASCAMDVATVDYDADGDSNYYLTAWGPDQLCYRHR